MGGLGAAGGVVLLVDERSAGLLLPGLVEQSLDAFLALLEVG